MHTIITVLINIFLLIILFVCYFSYSYDPTHTLQYNLAPNFGLPDKFVEPEPSAAFGEAEPETEVFDNNLDKTLIHPKDSDEPEGDMKDKGDHSDDKCNNALFEGNLFLLCYGVHRDFAWIH